MDLLRLTFEVDGRVADFSHPIHLDALLAYAATEESDGDWRNIVLPLDMEQGVYKASALHFERAGVGVLRRARQFAEEMYIDGMGKVIRSNASSVSLASGKFKNSFLKTNLVLTRKAVAWCVGDKERIEALLQRIRCIGALSKIGLGRVVGVSVEADPDAAQKWMSRVLPWCQQEGEYYPVVSCLTPPYWKKENQVKAWVHKDIA